MSWDGELDEMFDAGVRVCLPPSMAEYPREAEMPPARGVSWPEARSPRGPVTVTSARGTVTLAGDAEDADVRREAKRIGVRIAKATDWWKSDRRKKTEPWGDDE